MTDRTRKAFYSIMALLVSIGAWMFVVYNYYPMTDVNYSDVPVKFEGQRELAERGLAISEASTEGIGVRLNQKRVNYNNYSVKDIRVVANVADCVAGENQVNISVTGPKDTSVVAHDTDTVSVKVERTDSALLDIEAIYSEDAEENAAPIITDIGQQQAEVICAAGKLSTIKRVAAVLNQSELGDAPKSFTVDLVALDASGKIVPYAVIYPGEISLDASAGVVKEVPLNLAVKNAEDENYERKYSAPETLTVIGSKDAMSKLESINAYEIDLGIYYEDSEIAVEYELPEGVQLYGEEDEPILILAVTKKEKQKTGTENQSENSAENEAGSGN